MFWKNPEFLRHRRSELRRGRAITVLAVVLVICSLSWLGNWGSHQASIVAYRSMNPPPKQLADYERQAPFDLWSDFYQILMTCQVAVLTFWSLLCCAQSVSGERERKTWDFQRATSLTPAEFLIGKLLGEPVVAWFIVLLCIPLTVVAAWRGNQGVASVFSLYALIFSSALFVGLAGLWLSNLFETRSRGIGLIGTFGLYLLLAFAIKLRNSAFPGFAGFSPITEMDRLFDPVSPQHATIFGVHISWLAMSLILYSTFGAWFVLMILRSLKKDFDQIKPLSRWQSVGCAAFLNFTLYALYRPAPPVEYVRDMHLRSSGFVSFMVGVSAVILFAMGLAMISPYDRLKIWWRERHGLESLLAEDSPPLPWLVVSAATAYIFLIWGMFAWKSQVGFDARALLSGLLQSVTVLIFVTRDILFLQFCRLTKLRAPLLKGFLYLALYYIAAAVLSGVVGSSDHYTRGQSVLALLTPTGAFEIGPGMIGTLPEVVVGLVIQIAAIIFIMAATANKLKRATMTARAA
jgi:hypothetical protein